MSKACIQITAVPAFSPIPGMIGAVSGKPPIEQAQASTVSEALEKSASMSHRLEMSGVSHVLLVTCTGRKPKGFSEHVWNMRRSWVATRG